MANYHPNAELLMQFAAGQLQNALGIMVACHLQTCPNCRHQVRTFERLGGELLEDTWNAVDSSMKVSDDLLDSTLSRLQEAEPRLPGTDKQLTGLPKPLQRFVPADFDDLPWYGFSKNIQQYDLSFGENDEYVAKFYKIKAGKELPEHTHRGNEYTMVMSGAFSDDAGSYYGGDFILADQHTKHRPKAHEDKDCICFAVMDAPLKLTGFWGAVINPFLR
ncbi:ChrR family anti-sigma-E factor [Bermanella sp. R86510]|uniref:ChrR family anti-sigma-E factor n=1 Tax=unclassified Bermanella TaxID=2627862 RepID=UPI0037CA7688